MIRDDWKPLRTIGTFTRRSPDGTLIETYHDGYAVNDTGAFIWSHVGGDATVSEIADRLVERYGIDRATALDAVRTFLADLLERGFVVPDGEPAGDAVR